MGIVAVIGAVVAVVAAVAVWSCRSSGRPMRELAHAGAAASATTIAPQELPARQSATLAEVARLGFGEAPPVRVSIPGRPPGLYANARRHDGATWFRSLSITPDDIPSRTFLTSFRGGRLATTDLVGFSIDPSEAVQCLPGAGLEQLLAIHDEALAVIGARGVEPVPLADDLARHLEDEWHTESRLVLAAGPVRQMLLELTTRNPRPTPRIAELADPERVVERLRGS